MAKDGYWEDASGDIRDEDGFYDPRENMDEVDRENEEGREAEYGDDFMPKW
ncbi:hypothetical protein K0O13_08050 [Mammaliicoccus sciuri]|uniref:hypothetical protein n=1 Tax=Mammaliicoccus sciuri TaxID=1296 RepID=UPI001C626F7A|nr:hypothetical protein [Mammaliicoccus sciuri]QYG30052.1 hypothetical protein K0O13_08050 [Mammaliicoccus sciuri]